MTLSWLSSIIKRCPHLQCSLLRVRNPPEPYIEIRHYCNNAEGETITLPEFNKFVPDTYEIGTVILDNGKTSKRNE
uniref:Transthyretin-like family protein n=1 Tax=Heterorhabditis bacteriophora TaxID=37862 RepID=A0A1I7XQW8_HETBA